MSTESNLSSEAESIQELLKGKVIARILRPGDNEICIECSDGMRLFVESKSALAFSVTG